ncbi:DUF2891 domain-containing protein [Piscinibacter terrae]|uniref:DUF2891 domain-containing protein n=1 Tax=Piscinibacter terrae TaxID=2496871 RepID=A0A3N7HR69_9BURK|nr:DUF2891 domain-containing protein [Albitalea terrae]RQP24758.1 DUF2891 domain-containing protein [Albitalea terrae]
MLSFEHFVRAQADALADCALHAVRREFPHKLDHLILHAQDQPLPRDIHPVFWGSYDWHSSVHMHWSLLRLRAMVPALALRSEIEQHLDEHFTPDKVAIERAYAATPGRAAFERPYGWAWLLKLQYELEASGADSRVQAWAQALAPLADDIALRLTRFLGLSHYPVRAGTHANYAFAMVLARDFALRRNDAALRSAIDAAAERWFGQDHAYPSHYEPGGSDFLSAGLCEALLMSRVLGERFPAWWQSFDAAGQALRHWLQPAIVSDRVDAQLVHLDGLNLSRAWCLSSLADQVGRDQHQPMLDAAQAHWHAAWPHIITGDFAATHWLVSFALLSV